MTLDSQLSKILRLFFLAALVASFSAHAGGNKGKRAAKKPVKWSKLKYASAKAYTFNFEPFGPGHKGLRAFGPIRGPGEDTVGMHPKIRNSAPLTAEQASEAFALVRLTEGAARMSKCAFPRHGVVFFDKKGDPIASVNICFECGDILIWPEWDRRPSAKKNSYGEVFTKKYDKAMSGWTTLFQSLDDMPIDWKSALPRRSRNGR
jgi:hypothetical protein